VKWISFSLDQFGVSGVVIDTLRSNGGTPLYLNAQKSVNTILRKARRAEDCTPYHAGGRLRLYIERMSPRAV
jgi:hypothetical protein